jgi:hypothetical protein
VVIGAQGLCVVICVQGSGMCSGIVGGDRGSRAMRGDMCSR